MLKMRRKPDLKPTATVWSFLLEAIEVGGSFSDVLNSWIYSIVSASHTLMELSLPMVTRVPDMML